MKLKYNCNIMDMTGQGIGDDLYGMMMRGANNSAAARLRAPVEEFPAANTFGGGSAPSAPQTQAPHTQSPAATDPLADFDSWWQDSNTSQRSSQPAQQPANSQPARPHAQAPAQTPAQSAQPASTGSQISPTPPAQGVQGAEGGAKSPTSTHPAVGEFKFSSAPSAQHLADHYKASLPADMFNFTAEDQAKMAAGDFSPLSAKSATMQQTFAYMMAAAVADATKIIEGEMKDALSIAFNNYGTHVTREAGMREAVGSVDRGSLKFMASAVADRYMRDNPNATPEQVKAATARYIDGLRQAFTSQGKPSTPVNQPEDWVSFLNA